MEYHLLLVEVPQFKVSFDLDANGILNMSAQDKSTAGSRIVLLAMAKAVTNLSELEVSGGSRSLFQFHSRGYSNIRPLCF